MKRRITLLFMTAFICCTAFGKTVEKFYRDFAKIEGVELLTESTLDDDDLTHEIIPVLNIKEIRILSLEDGDEKTVKKITRGMEKIRDRRYSTLITVSVPQDWLVGGRAKVLVRMDGPAIKEIVVVGDVYALFGRSQMMVWIKCDITAEEALENFRLLTDM